MSKLISYAKYHESYFNLKLGHFYLDALYVFRFSEDFCHNSLMKRKIVQIWVFSNFDQTYSRQIDLSGFSVKCVHGVLAQQFSVQFEYKTVPIPSERTLVRLVL